jgi:hypothetical protein
MDHPLRTISYIADIGNIVVLMARRRTPRSNSQESVEASHPSQDGKRQYKMICHVFESEDVRVASPISLWEVLVNSLSPNRSIEQPSTIMPGTVLE